MSRPRRAAALTLAVAAAAFAQTSAQAEQSDGANGRCALLGQIAMTEWLGLPSALGADTPVDAVDDAMTRADRALSLYAAAACETPLLAAAMDCVLVSERDVGLRDRARRCLIDAGLARGE